MSEVENKEAFSLREVCILFVGVTNHHVVQFAPDSQKITVASALDVTDEIRARNLQLIVFDSIRAGEVELLRKYDDLVLVPVLIISDSFEGVTSLDSIMSLPRVVLCNTCAAKSQLFVKRLLSLVNRDISLLPARTALIVKYTVLFINNSVGKQITRGKLSEKAGVTEDYLTRIFHQEMGMSLWDYVNCYRMYYACTLLLQTDDSIREIADLAGFPDAAYFNRVFHKQYGSSPGQFRKTGLPS